MHNGYKVKGVADIVFLMDATSDMQNCIDKFKENVGWFFKNLTEGDPESRHVPIVRDWRAKVVGFRDVEVDGDEWFEDNCFTRDIAEVERQLGALTARGGGDMPESLLDAIYKVADAPKSEKGEEDPSAWRHRSEAHRVVVAFTDAPYKPTMSAPGIAGGDIRSLRNICVQERIFLTVVAPRGVDDDGFGMLAAIRYSNWISIPSYLETSPLDGLMNDREALTKMIQVLAWTIARPACHANPPFPRTLI
jgi:hypothetical protein